MHFERFELERFQSIWEHHVAWNVAESGVHPLRIEEVAETDAERAALLAQHLIYTQTNGTLELRSLIASMYPSSGPDHIQVTNGGSEANFLVLLHLLKPGDHVVIMAPNYMQVYGVARALGADVALWHLVEDTAAKPSRWRADLDSLRALVTPRTRAVLICNPNNPTGARLTAAELDAICDIAGTAGAWVVADEIYRGAELDGVETASVWGRGERTIVTSGLSKAYGLPGLRIGWIAATPKLIEDLWGIHDYTTIAPAAASDVLARMALAPGRRDKIIARTRGIVRTNYPVVRKWIEKRGRVLTHIPPEAGAIVFVRYRHDINSTALAERLRDQQSVLVVPGDHFGMDGYLRIGFGADPVHLTGSLERIGEVLDAIESGAHAS
jgi:aspartate/methionine/tyrosine aminotransferase